MLIQPTPDFSFSHSRTALCLEYWTENNFHSEFCRHCSTDFCFSIFLLRIPMQSSTPSSYVIYFFFLEAFKIFFKSQCSDSSCDVYVCLCACVFGGGHFFCPFFIHCAGNLVVFPMWTFMFSCFRKFPCTISLTISSPNFFYVLFY